MLEAIIPRENSFGGHQPGVRRTQRGCPIQGAENSTGKPQKRLRVIQAEALLRGGYMGSPWRQRRTQRKATLRVPEQDNIAQEKKISLLVANSVNHSMIIKHITP